MDEGLPVVESPGILKPEDFLKEVLTERLPNPFLMDTPQRIATDTSQKVGIRFGETIKAYARRDGGAKGLTAVPLAIAGWLRYLLAVDDAGQPFELSPDPMAERLHLQLSNASSKELRPLLSNANLFGSICIRPVWEKGSRRCFWSFRPVPALCGGRWKNMLGSTV